MDKRKISILIGIGLVFCGVFFHLKQTEYAPDKSLTSGGEGTHLNYGKGEVLSINEDLIQVKLDLTDDVTRSNFRNEDVICLDCQDCVSSTMKSLKIGEYIEFQFLDFSINNEPIILYHLEILKSCVG